MEGGTGIGSSSNSSSSKHSSSNHSKHNRRSSTSSSTPSSSCSNKKVVQASPKASRKHPRSSSAEGLGQPFCSCVQSWHSRLCHSPKLACRASGHWCRPLFGCRELRICLQDWSSQRHIRCWIPASAAAAAATAAAAVLATATATNIVWCAPVWRSASASSYGLCVHAALWVSSRPHPAQVRGVRLLTPVGVCGDLKAPSSLPPAGFRRSSLLPRLSP